MEDKENPYDAGIILFNVGKREFGSPNSNFKKLANRLASKYKVEVNDEPLSFEILAEANCVILAGPQEMFSLQEFDALKKYVQSGGNILVLMQEGGESRTETNINYFLEEYGVSVNPDSVVRSVYYKYFHPKENLISNGVLNKEIQRVASGRPRGN